MFSEVDEAIKRDRIITAHASVRKRLVFDDLPTGSQTGLLPAMCRPKIIRHFDY